MKSSRVAWCAVVLSASAVLIAVPVTALAQAGDPEPFAPLAGASKLWAFWPKGTYFEGDPMLPLALRSRTARVRTIPEDSRNGSWSAWGNTLSIIPRFTFRQSDAKSVRSAPVLTPTFNPYAEFSAIRLSTRAGTERRRLFPSFDDSSRIGSIVALQLRVGHYSNGQVGCLYAAATPDTLGNCSRVPAGATLNIRDGSFSTHYVEGSVAPGWLWFDANLAERVMMGIAVAARHNPSFLAGAGGMNTELADAYGRTSVSLRAEFRMRTDRNFGYYTWLRPSWPMVFRVVGEAQQFLCRASAYAATARSFEVSVAFPRAYGLGAVVRYQAGPDYYNVAFGTPIKRPLSVGLMFDHSQPIALTRAAKSRTSRLYK